MKLIGIDHVDIRVRSIAEVEAFYDALMPALGVSHKTASHVAADGEWHDVDDSHPRNVFEYFPPQVVGQVSWFVGLIEDAETIATATRVAFTLDDEEALAAVERIVREAGGSVVESSIVETYPAIFF
ncbi:MAG: hypothetical protein IAI50_01625, partial [Candidatus Eremiobacteraeota bacterium]|nr:hypothetical protein [Candidatus Eremiobacteraeota bacterium]